MRIGNNWKSYKILLLVLFVVGEFSALSGSGVALAGNGTTWTHEFNIENRTFSSIGRNEFFILEPGYQLTLEGKDEEDTITLVITVLNETVMVGNVETRVVEERESENGELIEISRNFFAICTETQSVFYFGEDVEMYEDGKLVSHEGEWRADNVNYKAGIMMPGLILLGSRYHQEYAPGVAMDRAEIISTTITMKTPAGTFENCLRMEENNPVDGETEYKVHAPGIGLIKDEDLLLISYGFIEPFKPVEPINTTVEPITTTLTTTTTAIVTTTETTSITTAITTTVSEMSNFGIFSTFMGLIMGIGILIELRKKHKY